MNQKFPSCFASNALRFQIGDTDDDDCSDTSFCQVSVSQSICSESYVPEDARSNDSRRSWQVVPEDVLSNASFTMVDMQSCAFDEVEESSSNETGTSKKFSLNESVNDADKEWPKLSTLKSLRLKKSRAWPLSEFGTNVANANYTSSIQALQLEPTVQFRRRDVLPSAVSRSHKLRQFQKCLPDSVANWHFAPKSPGMRLSSEEGQNTAVFMKMFEEDAGCAPFTGSPAEMQLLQQQLWDVYSQSR